MALLDRIRKPKTNDAAKKEVSKKPTTDASAPVAQTKLVTNAFASNVLVRPHVSEKASRLMEAGAYTFDVLVSAEKISIKKAVQALYNVKVTDVRIVRHAGKPMSRGKYPGARKHWKKAIVTLAKGQKLDLYQGV